MLHQINSVYIFVGVLSYSGAGYSNVVCVLHHNLIISVCTHCSTLHDVLIVNSRTADVNSIIYVQLTIIYFATHTYKMVMLQYST